MERAEKPRHGRASTRRRMTWEDREFEEDKPRQGVVVSHTELISRWGRWLHRLVRCGDSKVSGPEVPFLFRSQPARRHGRGNRASGRSLCERAK